MSKNDLFLEYEGKVIKKLSDGYFKIEFLKGVPVKLITASVANRLKSIDYRWKKIAEGDKVRVEISPGDPTKGRIIKLLD